MSDLFSQAKIDNKEILDRFIAQTQESCQIERADLVAQEILKWTQGNSLLIESLCQLILEREDQVIEGQESRYVERIVRSLVKYWESEKDRKYYPHFQAIKAVILQNKQVNSVLLRLHEIILQKQVIATESLEDTILLNSGVLNSHQNKLKIANFIYAEIFNSEWIKQQLDQINQINQASDKLTLLSQELTTKVDDQVKQKKIPRKVLAIVALTFLGILGGVVSFLSPLSSASAAKKCRIEPTNLDLAAQVLEACDRTLSRHPDNIEALINRGKVSLVLWKASQNQARINSAINDFTQARELEPNNPRAAFYQSYLQEFQELVVKQNPNCNSTSDRYQDALKLYQPFNKLSKADIPLVLELGYFLINREQNYPKAIKIFDAVIKFDPNLSQAWAGKATAQFLSKDYFNAQESLNQALALNPDSSMLKYNLGSLWAKLGNYNKASQLYQQVTRKEPDFALAWRDLGLTMYLQNRYQEAALAFTRIVYRPNSKSFYVSNRDRNLIADYYERAEDCLHEKIDGLDMSCSSENRIPMEVDLTYQGVFHNIIAHGAIHEPFFEVEHHRFFHCSSR
jgi:tetratricopeptide (TPR) repeat protein